MTLAVADRVNKSRFRLRRTQSAQGVWLDLVIFLVATAFCVAFLFEGGLEALIGAALGALIASRRQAVQGAFAGLFTGCLFAGFFHSALAALFAAAF